MDDKRPTYEEAVKRLEEIVKKLESGAAPLDESIALFSEGAEVSFLSPLGAIFSPYSFTVGSFSLFRFSANFVYLISSNNTIVFPINSASGSVNCKVIVWTSASENIIFL